MAFTNGLTLARNFFDTWVEPLIAQNQPQLRYAAALIGYGSEVLGFDTAMSTDHNWGPRLQIFMSETDIIKNGPALASALEASLPECFEGWPVCFGNRNCPMHAHTASGPCGPMHGIAIYSLEAWARREHAINISDPLTVDDWLGIPEQSLLEVTAGAVFRDDLGDLTALRQRLAYYPQDIWLYKLACQWMRIGEEQAFVGRCGEVEDDLGSRIVAARLVRDVMRLGFLIERRYAPYPKWFGSSFFYLPCARILAEPLSRVLVAEDWKRREAALADCYRLAAELHTKRKLPGNFSSIVGPYFERPFTVINADEIAAALRVEIADGRIRQLPYTGTIDQFSDSTALLDNPALAKRIGRALRTGTE